MFTELFIVLIMMAIVGSIVWDVFKQKRLAGATTAQLMEDDPDFAKTIRYFRASVREHQLDLIGDWTRQERQQGVKIFTARRPHCTVSLIYTTRAPTHVLQCEQKYLPASLHLQSIVDRSSAPPRIETGDQRFDSAFALINDPAPGVACALLTSALRSLLLVLHARLAQVTIAQGTLSVSVNINTHADQSQNETITETVRDFFTACQRLQMPADPINALASLIETGTDTPGLQLEAIRALLSYRQTAPQQVLTASIFILDNPSSSLDLRVWAALAIGDEGFPFLSALLPKCSSVLRASALSYLLESAPSDKLEALVESAFCAWMFDPSAPLLAPTLRYMEQHPSPGRLPLLGLHLDAYDPPTYSCLLRALVAHSTPDTREALLLSHVQWNNNKRLQSLAPVLGSLGGPLTIKALNDVKLTDSAQNLLREQMISSIQRRLIEQGSATGQLSLSTENQSGTLAFPDANTRREEGP